MANVFLTGNWTASFTYCPHHGFSLRYGYPCFDFIQIPYHNMKQQTEPMWWETFFMLRLGRAKKFQKKMIRNESLSFFESEKHLADTLSNLCLLDSLTLGNVDKHAQPTSRFSTFNSWLTFDGFEEILENHYSSLSKLIWASYRLKSCNSWQNRASHLLLQLREEWK